MDRFSIRRSRRGPPPPPPRHENQAPRVLPHPGFTQASADFNSLLHRQDYQDQMTLPHVYSYFNHDVNHSSVWYPSYQTAFAAPSAAPLNQQPAYGNYFEEINPSSRHYFEELNASWRHYIEEINTPLRHERAWMLEEETAILDEVPREPHNYGHHYLEEEDTAILEGSATMTSEERESRCLREGLILKNLKTRKCCATDNGHMCVICQDDLLQENIVIGTLPCKHEFHASCIAEWLQMKNTCPLCKSVAMKQN